VLSAPDRRWRSTSGFQAERVLVGGTAMVYQRLVVVPQALWLTPGGSFREGYGLL
jgi:hypothetical protein